MTSDRFTDWLQGFFEISGAKELSEREVTIIKDKLSLVKDEGSPVGTGNGYLNNFQLICDNDNVSHTAEHISTSAIGDKPYRGPLQS